MFYLFDQNNSGGSFNYDSKLCRRLFIEADSHEQANEIAQSFGVYFNGVELGLDCRCCGDRWYEGNELKFPLKWSKDITVNTIEEYAELLLKWYGKATTAAQPSSRIFYKNGEVKAFYDK